MEVFTKAASKSDAGAKAILKVRKELDTVTGLKRLIGGKMARRITNMVNGALSPKELEALRGAMNIKFFKNMDNPGKLTALARTTPNLDLSTAVGTNLGQFIQRLPDARRQSFQTAWDSIQNVSGGKSKILESQLAFLKTNAPDVYKSAQTSIVNAAAKGNNPLYKQFMNSEINGLGSYFSKDYMNLINWNGVTARFSNMVPVLYNELKDVGEDTLMAMGIEEQDDINGLFWPMIKSLLGSLEDAPIVGPVIKGATGITKGTLSAAGEIPFIQTAVGAAADAAGAGEKTVYDPTTQFVIHPDDSPVIKKKEKEKANRIEKSKSWF